MSKSRDRRRRWQKRETKGMNQPFARAMHKLGRAANSTAREFKKFGEVLHVGQ